jgi:signal transduction histidine kinase/ActR/RegA family two-component response regulator
MPKGEWRDALLQRVLLASLPLAVLSVLATLVLSTRSYQPLQYEARAGLVLVAAALALVTWRQDWPRAVRAGTLVAAFTYSTVSGYVIGGFQGNMALVGGASVVFAGLLFGRKRMLALLAALAVVPVGVGFGMVTGAIALPDPVQTALSAPQAWTRTTVVAIALWAILGLTVTFVVEHIEGALRAEHEALVGLRAAQEKREQAEQQRREAEQIAAQAQKLELVGQLAVGVAHDFNNVLSVVQCWADLAYRNPTEQNRTEGRESILAATRQGSALAQQLLAFSRRNVRTVREIELEPMVDGIMKMLRRLLPDNVKLAIEHGDRAFTRVDETELNQILLNLIVNARDAMRGGGRLRVATGVETFAVDRQVIGALLPAGTWARITVEDSGAGIDPSLASRVFEPFFTTKPAGTGTGLGLATVLTIARESGGGVALVSEPGRGASFTVYLPEVSGLAKPSRVTPVQPAKPGPATVLLVEDSQPVRTLMHVILEQAGHKVVASADGQGALQALGQGEFDLLCTDAAMPGAPVREVIDAFEKKNPRGRVLVVSGHVDEELTRRGIEQGRYTLLRKPFLPPMLCAVVDEVLAQAGREAEDVEARRRRA